MKTKKLLKALMSGLLAACLIFVSCPSYLADQNDQEDRARAALSGFRADGPALLNKRADGERLQVFGARQNHTAVGLENSSATFDISTLKAEGFTAFVGLDASAKETDKVIFTVEADGREIAASAELLKGESEKLTAVLPSNTATLTLKTEGTGLGVFGDAAVTFPISGEGYVDMTALNLQQQINDPENPLKTNTDIKIGTSVFDKGFAVYPMHNSQAGYVSELYFDVSNINAKTFYSKIGLNNAENTNGVIFKVYADGQKVYESGVMTGTTPAKDVAVDISGSHLLTLTVYDNGDNDGDNAVWAQPRLSLDGGEITHMTDYVTASLTKLEWKNAISESKSPQINKPYENGADYKINVGGLEYNYGISAHPYNNTTPSTITYDLSSYDFDGFSVIVGKTKEKNISVDNQDMTEKFLIYGDGKLLCESEPIAMGHYTALWADIKDVDILTIAIEAGDAGYGWGACAWCEPTLYRELEEGEIAVLSPFGDSEGEIIGNRDLNITGAAKGMSTVKVTLGNKLLGTCRLDENGGFSAKIKSKNLELGKNVLTLSSLDGKSQKVTIEITKKNKYSIMNMDWKSQTGVFMAKGTSVQSIFDRLSIGSQMHQTDQGFCIKPGAGGEDYADVVVELGQLDSTVEFFTALVGIDDFALFDEVSSGGSVVYQVLADGKLLTQTGILTANEMTSVCCDIPAGTKELTLRVTNAGDGNSVDYADWLFPYLYQKKSDFGSVEKDLYSDNNVGGNRKVSAAQVGVRFAPSRPFSAITLIPEAASERVTGSLYKFIYSYERSIQGGALSTVTATKDSSGKYVFELNKEYDEGEYIFVADGVTEIYANGSQYGYYYLDGIPFRGLVNMSVRFTATFPNYLSSLSPEPETVNAGTDRATAAEKARAEKTYKEMITNLGNFPSKMTIGEDSYVGFGSSDFTLKSADVREDKVTKSQNTTFILEHKSGLEFELRCVYYPEYAAFDWVVYFTNKGEENSPKICDISPAELTFEGDNPIILSNYSDGGPYAPFMPRTIYLSDGDIKTFAPQNGRSTEAAFPYYNLEYGNKGAFVVTSWSGIWQADFAYKDGVTSYSGKQQTFSSYLKPGETARTPLTAMILYDGRDTDRATNLWRNWFMDCNMYKNDGQNLPEPFVAGVTSAIYREMSNATEENQIDAIRKYLDNNVDIDVWWMDADWFAGLMDADGWTPLGNWVPNSTRFPTNFKSISDYANANGIKTLLWFEPERVSISTKQYSETPDTEYRVKPEWLIGYGEAGDQIAYGKDGSAFQLDMGNKEALDWLINRVSAIIKEGGLSIYREDLNSNSIDETWAATNSAHPDRAGIVENGCVMGHYKYWDMLLALEEIEMIDSCASGGHRLDLETMRRAVALHPTDFNYNDLTSKQIGTYGLAAWFPFTGANTGVGNYLTQADKYVLRSAYRQSLILQYDINKLSGEKYKTVEMCVNEWRGISKYFYEDIYQLTNSTLGANEWYSYEYLSQQEQSGFAMVFRRSAGAPESQNIKLKGLNHDDTYEITFADQGGSLTATGDRLMFEGMTVVLDENEQYGCDSEIIYIKRINSVTADLEGLKAAVDSAKAIIDKGLVSAGYTGMSGFEMICAYEKALAVYENPGESDNNINSAAALLNSAIESLAKGSAGTKEEIENIIGSIGEINEQNYRYRYEMLEFVRELVESSGVAPENIGLLEQAEKSFADFSKSQTPGDVDGDREVTVNDALLALQAAVGKITLDADAERRADVDKTAGVSVSDALLILQKAVNKIQSFDI